MLTSQFDYDLPADAIALRPPERRDSARLLVDVHSDVARRAGVEHRSIADLASYLRSGDVVVLNDTRVLPARVRFTRSSGGSGEVLLLDELDDGWWEALARPSAKLGPGTVVEVGNGLGFEFGDDLGEGRRLVRPIAEGGLHAALDRFGEMPLPPYLGDATLEDPERYQTVYSRRAASSAAPTAGLHLTPDLLAQIEIAGARVARVELVVGLGTFRPMSSERVDEHVMHHERYHVPSDTWDAVTGAERVVAIGTTTVRALESVAATGHLDGRTDLFIRRPFEWQVVDALLTNFHLPRSSLLVMIDAFIGERWRELYSIALRERYRFLSFGDAMLLTRREGLR